METLVGKNTTCNESARFWRDRAVFLTGATGLLGGSVAARLLDLGARVVCLVRDRVSAAEFHVRKLDERCTLVLGDVCQGDLVRRALSEYDVRTVLHLAAQTQVEVALADPTSTFETNIAGTWRLLEAARLCGHVEQLIVASSDKAYGVHKELPYRETSALQASAPYDVSKACQAQLARSYAFTYGLNVCTTFNGNLFGPGDLNWRRLIPGTVRTLLHGERPVLRSNGKASRDYLYVKDGALALQTLVEAMSTDPALRGEWFNFGNGKPYSVLDVTARLQRLTGRVDLDPIIMSRAEHEPAHQFLSSDKASELLGWTPQWDFDLGLAETVAWYSDRLSSAWTREGALLQAQS